MVTKRPVIAEKAVSAEIEPTIPAELAGIRNPEALADLVSGDWLETAADSKAITLTILDRILSKETAEEIFADTSENVLTWTEHLEEPYTMTGALNFHPSRYENALIPAFVVVEAADQNGALVALVTGAATPVVQLKQAFDKGVLEGKTLMMRAKETRENTVYDLVLVRE